MNDVENKVFTAVKNSVVVSGTSLAWVTSERSLIPAQFPCVWCEEADNTTSIFTGNNHEKASDVMYEINVFSNLKIGKKAECKKIMGLVDACMVDMGFTRTLCQPVDNSADMSIYRMVARYTATVMNNTIYRR